MYLKINTNQELSDFVDEILNSKTQWIALDTEFERRDTYFPLLSLLQIATSNKTWVIDALQPLDFKPLQKLLENSKILKVWHAGDQDFEAINYKLRIKVYPFIDTQIMATFASMGKALSLEKLVLNFFNETMDKSLQNSSWLCRPLKERQIAYAARDAEYIAKVYPLLKEALIKLDRFNWVMEEMQLLFEKYASSSSNSSESKEWLKFCHPKQRFHNHLYAYVLLNWRETMARLINKNRKSIISDALIEQIIAHKSHLPYTSKLGSQELLQNFLQTWDTIQELRKSQEMQQHITKKVNEYYAIIPPEQETRLKNFKNHIQTIANNLNIPQDFILNKQQQLLAIKTEGASLKGWRAQVLIDFFKIRAES